MSKEINYCSCGCLRKKYGDTIELKHGQTQETKYAQWVGEKKALLLSIAPSQRSLEHPLGKQHTHQTTKSLWKKIAVNPHKNLMEVEEVCQCTALVKPINGVPLYNAQTTPTWLALRVGWSDYLQEKGTLDHQEWSRIMADLCTGLRHLHNLGVAHGDPFPFNVLIKNDGTAVWVDFGNITDAPDYFVKDVYAFVLYTLLFSMKWCSAISVSLLEELANALLHGTSIEMLQNIQQALCEKREDWDYAYSEQDITEYFFTKLLNAGNEAEQECLKYLHQIALLGNENYYAAFLYWLRTGKYFEEKLAVEQEKFRLYSSEIDRLTIPRYVYNNLASEKAQIEAESKNWQQKYMDETAAYLQYRSDIAQQTVPLHIYEELSARCQETTQQRDALNQKYLEVCAWAESQTAKHLEVCQWADYLTEHLNQVSANCAHSNLVVKTHTSQIRDLLSARSFRRWVSIYALLRKLKNSRLIDKCKLIIKLFLRLFGKRYDLGLSEYNPTIRIWSSIHTIHEASCASVIQAIEQPGNTAIPANIYAEETRENFTVPAILEYVTLPKVTVLLPAYNHAEFIHLAVDSILNQTYNNLELIMLDDGSTDGLAERVKKYQQDYRFKFYHQPNQKLPMALSHLHELATGDYVTWTSADNIMEPDMIETLVEEMQKRPDAEMIFGDVIIIDEDGNPLLDQEYRDFNRDLVIPEILRLPRNTEPLGAECDNYVNASFMYRRSASQALGNAYACDLVGLEDYDYWLRMQRCGKIIHAEAKRPLYRYRVHKNTMSEELLTAKREQHIKRADAMIHMEFARADWAKERWHLNTECNAALAEAIEKIAKGIAVNLKQGEQKNLWIFDSEAKPVGDLQRDAYCICENDQYRLGRFANGQWICFVEIPFGNDIHPLALKARYTHMPSPYYEYCNVGDRITLGCHVALSRIDIDAALNLIHSNPNFYFVFVNTENKAVPQLTDMISKENNAVCLGYREFGVPYRMYSSWHGVFIPKMHNITENQVLESYQLALMLGKWCSYDEGYDFLNGTLYTIPHGIHHDFGDISVLVSSPVDFNRMDLLLSTMTREARMEKMLRYANGMMQDANVTRPDFGITVSKEVKPVLVPLEYPDSLEALKKEGGHIALAVDTLNQGGMEQVIAMMAHKLHSFGFFVDVLCTVSGGTVADQLRADGFRVTEFSGDANAMTSYLKADPPLIISSHYLHTCADVPHKLGIPMVETLHNMFAFFDKDAWSKEEKRRKYFDGYIAVSEMVRDYYCAFNKAVNYKDVQVIGNAADPKRVSGANRGLFRKTLGLSENDYVYVFVASFDGRKNHIGLITAFIDARKKVNAPLKLILLGNVLDMNFYNKCCDYIRASNSEDSIILVPYRKEIASVLADADVALIPSYIEGWSISATEAQYAGKPLIHTNCGSGHELCGNNEFGILIDNPAGDPLAITQDILYTCMAYPDPANTEMLTNTLISMYENRTIWKKKEPMIRSRAIREFNYDVMVMKYLDEFHRILKERTIKEHG